MATDHNFRIKNGLTVGAVEVIDSSGKLTSNAFGTNSNEKIEDVVADMITGSTHSNITVTYNDTNGTLVFSAAAQYGDSDVESYLDGGTSTPSFASISSGAITSTGTSTFDAIDVAQIEIGDGGTSGNDSRNIGSRSNYLLIQRNGAVPIELWGSNIQSRTTHYFGGSSTDAEANIDTSGNFTTTGTINSGAITTASSIDAGSVEANGMFINTPDGSSAPAITALLRIYGYEGRVAGI